MPTSERADNASAAMKRQHADADGDEKRHGIDRKREDQPAEQAEADGVENKSKGKHGGGSVCIEWNGRAFHHHRGAILDIKSKLGGVAALATPPGFGKVAKTALTRRRTSRRQCRAASPCRRDCPEFPCPGRCMRPIGSSSSMASLRLNGAALACLVQSGLKAICGTLRLVAHLAAINSAPFGEPPWIRTMSGCLA